MARIENWRLENLPGISCQGLKISRNIRGENLLGRIEIFVLAVQRRDISYWNVGEICCDGYWISKLATRANRKDGIFFYESYTWLYKLLEFFGRNTLSVGHVSKR